MYPLPSDNKLIPQISMNKILAGLLTASLASYTLLQLVSCSNKTLTAPDTKLLSAFHDTYYREEVDPITPDELALYVDYSTCIAEGQDSPFFQALVPSWTNATKSFFAIKGSTIEEHSADSTFLLLRNVTEVNYADIKTAAERIANGNTEGVLLTDGEYFQPSKALGNVNNPYLAEAFKTWLYRGHDIYIYIESYSEVYKEETYRKKRFYFLFTDNRLPGNIYDRIKQTVDRSQYAGVELFHLSADHPALYTEGGQTSSPHPILNARVTPGGSYEIQEWEIDWKNGIEPLLVNAIDPNTGEPLPEGTPFTSGLHLDKNSFGGYLITGVTARVYNINQAYSDFYNSRNAEQTADERLDDVESSSDRQIFASECNHFVKIDDKTWREDAVINLHFDTEYYDPASVLDGAPFNYFMIKLSVADIELEGRYKEMFSFDSIDMPGVQNVSITSSIEQCLADPSIIDKMKTCPIYTIYIKANQR